MDTELLSETFVELTDTMVARFDVIDFLHVLTDRSVQLLDVSAAGLLLADPRGELRVVAASNETARLLGLALAFIDGTEALTGPNPGRTRPPRPATRHRP
jgi:hypothetical protein